MATNVMGEYSQELFDEMWNIMERDYEQDYDSGEVIDKLGDPEFFRTFAERLLSFYNDALNVGFSADEATKDLQQCVKQKNIPLARNTIANWFSGTTEPKYGDNDRKNLFAIAFALGCDAAQTEELFHKVFLDRAFNKRSAREFIYLYCITNEKPLSIAEDLINQLDNIYDNSKNKDQTERTQFLADAIKQGMSDTDILLFITEHPHNFSLNNTAAKEHRQKLIKALTVGSDNNPGLAQQEFEHRQDELSDDKDLVGKDGKDVNSVDFMLYMIMGEGFTRKANAAIQSIREKIPRKEINNQFPNSQTLSANDPSSYTLRKDIILLYFYDYWVRDFLDGRNMGDYDGFVEGLNDILFESGFSPLYIGNPYDWLFMYCSACAIDDYTPLDRFRSLLA